MANPRLEFRSFTGDDRPALFLVHDALASGSQWKPNLGKIARCLRPDAGDLGGPGVSPTPQDGRCHTIGSLTTQLVRVRARIGAENVVVRGHSFTAGIALLDALEHPDRVAAAIVTNSMFAFAWVLAVASLERWNAMPDRPAIGET
jgi:pimeloyl-ACP methyl ester carboxylesterase